MAFVRKIKASLVREDINTYVGEETYLFYDIETGSLRIYDGTPGGLLISAGGGSANWGTITGSITSQTDLITLLDDYVLESTIGAPNGVAPLDGSSVVPLSYLPSPLFAPITESNITTLTAVDTAVASLGKWIVRAVEVADPTNVYSTEIIATHNGTDVDFARYGILELGTPISGLSVTVTLTGGNTMNLNVQSTSAVDVIVERVMAA